MACSTTEKPQKVKLCILMTNGPVGLLESIDYEELSVVDRDMLEITKENYVWKKIARKYGLILNTE